MKYSVGTVCKRLLCMAVCFTAVLGVVLPCAAAENETAAVRVGYFAFDGYHEQDDNGERSGYGYDMLQHLAGYAGFSYEYIGYDKSWSEMQEMLANGEIDLLTSAQKTPEREARFDFSNYDIGVSAAILTVKSGDTQYTQSDYANWNGMRVGMLNGNSRNDSFDAFAKENGFGYTPVYFDSTEEMVAELKSSSDQRKINAVVTSNLREIEGEWVLAQFDPSPFYIMVQKGNTALLERINRGLEQLYSSESGIRTALMVKYYTPTSGDEIAFSPEERAYIQQMKGRTLTAVINPDRAPYSWAEDGKQNGIFYDLAAEMISRSGLDIEFIEVGDRAEYGAVTERGEADIRFDAILSYNQAEEDGYWLTNAYTTVTVARVYRKDTTVFKTAAVPENRDITGSYADAMAKHGLSVTYYGSVGEAVQAVMNGERDAALLVTDAASLAVRNDITNRLVTDEMYGDERSYAVAVNRAQSPLLYSIMNKVVNSLGEKELDGIRQNYTTGTEKPFSLIGFFYDYPIYTLIAVVVILGIAALIVVLILLARKRKADQRRMLREHEQNELLKSALATAERADAAKSQFLSRVSHEMRTPLNAIIGFIELAKDSDAERTASYLASSDIAAKQLLSVINDVLDMSSIESGKMKIANASFNFRHLISSVTNIYGTQCKQKGIDFETRITTPVDDWLTGDELRVSQILMNLLGNAVKFTSEGHIRLTISETATTEDSVFLRFTVSDTGCGMSPEMMERLFKPFEQENATTARKYGGSGLGLSIVKSLVGMMNGSVGVESKQGRGTSFTVDLPFSRSGVDRSIPLPDGIDGLHILAVDDEASEREYISLVLERLGVRFTCVNGGEEALSELSRADEEGDSYNVCLIDWRMPDMNGFETTRSIRGRYGRDVVVIVVSAYDFHEAGETAKEAGANLFLSKPIFQSALFDLFMTLTNGRIAKPADEPQSWDFSGRRVLLAEDNLLNQVVVKGYLAKYNVVVETAENGQIAVDMFTASEPGRYDAILMDLQMPVMDGIEAAQAIRASNHPQAKTIQIIAQTADAFNEDITRVLGAGMNAHVAKPIKPDVLAKALHTAFILEN